MVEADRAEGPGAEVLRAWRRAAAQHAHRRSRRPRGARPLHPGQVAPRGRTGRRPSAAAWTSAGATTGPRVTLTTPGTVRAILGRISASSCRRTSPASDTSPEAMLDHLLGGGGQGPVWLERNRRRAHRIPDRARVERSPSPRVPSTEEPRRGAAVVGRCGALFGEHVGLGEDAQHGSRVIDDRHPGDAALGELAGRVLQCTGEVRTRALRSWTTTWVAPRACA
jgi:hypothetical protein